MRVRLCANEKITSLLYAYQETGAKIIIHGIKAGEKVSLLNVWLVPNNILKESVFLLKHFNFALMYFVILI